MKLSVMEFLLIVGTGILIAVSIPIIIIILLIAIERLLSRIFKREIKFSDFYFIVIFLTTLLGIYVSVTAMGSIMLDKFQNAYSYDIEKYQEIVKEKFGTEDLDVNYGVVLNFLSIDVKITVQSDEDITEFEKSTYGLFKGVDRLNIELEDVDLKDN